MTVQASFNTPMRIIREAYLEAGLIQEGSDPSSEQIARAVTRLNDLINFAMLKDGLKLWTVIDQSVPLVAGQSLYTLMPGGSVSMTKPFKVIDGYYLDSSSNRRPLFPIAWADWIRLSNTTSTGAVTQYFVDKQQDRLNINLWLTPDATAATGTVHLVLQQQVTNFTGVTDTLNFPQEWTSWLRWALADELAGGQPQAIMDRCQGRAQMYYSALTDADVEDAPTSFQPSERVGVEGKFR